MDSVCTYDQVNDVNNLPWLSDQAYNVLDREGGTWWRRGGGGGNPNAVDLMVRRIPTTLDGGFTFSDTVRLATDTHPLPSTLIHCVI